MRILAIALGWMLLAPSPAAAQAIGTFSWTLEPFCNVVTLTVSADGPAYRLTGYDDQCGAGRTPAAGVLTPTSDGRYTLAFYLITPLGPASHTSGTLLPGVYSGPWHDDGGHRGTLRFGAPPSGGVPRPIADLQRRVTGVCTGSEFVQKVREDGSVECGATSGAAAITGVLAGTGLAGGGTSGEVTLALAENGVGSVHILDGTIDAEDVNATQIQRRVVGTCASGEFVQKVRENGSVECGAAAGGGGGDITGVTAGTG
jgi:hypothetical protein